MPWSINRLWFTEVIMHYLGSDEDASFSLWNEANPCETSVQNKVWEADRVYVPTNNNKWSWLSEPRFVKTGDFCFIHSRKTGHECRLTCSLTWIHILSHPRNLTIYSEKKPVSVLWRYQREATLFCGTLKTSSTYTDRVITERGS